MRTSKKKRGTRNHSVGEPSASDDLEARAYILSTRAAADTILESLDFSRFDRGTVEQQLRDAFDALVPSHKFRVEDIERRVSSAARIIDSQLKAGLKMGLECLCFLAATFSAGFDNRRRGLTVEELLKLPELTPEEKKKLLFSRTKVNEIVDIFRDSLINSLDPPLRSRGRIPGFDPEREAAEGVKFRDSFADAERRLASEGLPSKQTNLADKLNMSDRTVRRKRRRFGHPGKKRTKK
jgi:hypothetical protein